MKINGWSATFLLVFCPSRLKDLARDFNGHINRPEVIEAKQKARKEVPNYEDAIDRMRRGLLVSFLLVCGSFVVAAILGRAYVSLGGAVSGPALEALQYSGIGILLWATLAKQGWSIQTMHGATVPEVVNEFLYRALYVFGSFCLALSVTLQAVENAAN